MDLTVSLMKSVKFPGLTGEVHICITTLFVPYLMKNKLYLMARNAALDITFLIWECPKIT